MPLYSGTVAVNSSILFLTIISLAIILSLYIDGIGKNNEVPVSLIIVTCAVLKSLEPPPPDVGSSDHSVPFQ